MTQEKQPLVSISVPAYNAEKTISDTLDSLLAQTYKNLKITVVDNASTDKTVEIVERYAAKDARVHLFRHPENIGGEANFSFCITLGEGEYTAIFHADDVYSATMVEEEVTALEAHKEAGAAFTLAEGIDENARTLRTYALPKGLLPGPDGLYHFKEVIKAILKYGNFLFFPSVMARTEFFQNRIKRWNGETYKTSADLDVWLRILKERPVVIIDRPLLRYRLTASSYSYNLARTRTWRLDLFLVMDDYVKNAAPGLLSWADRLNYELQELKDNVNRAFVCLLQGKRVEGLKLLSGLFNPVTFLFALKSLFHLKVLAYGFAVLSLYFIPLTTGLKEKLFKLRFGN